MFNVTGGEVMIILVIALVVLGPEKLPDMIRKAGRLYGEVRRMANGFQSEIRDAFDEPTRELRETAEMARNAMTGAVSDMTSVVQSTFRDDGHSGEPFRSEVISTPVIDATTADARPAELQPAPGEPASDQPEPAVTSPFDGKQLSAAPAVAAPVPTAPPAVGAAAASLPTPLPPPPPAPGNGAASPASLAAPLPPPAGVATPNGNGDH